MNTNSDAQERTVVPRWTEQERLAKAAEVKTLRTARGWSQQELADVAGVARGTIGNMENGMTPQADTLASVLTALDANPAQPAQWSENVRMWLNALAPLVDRLADGQRERVMLGVLTDLAEALRTGRVTGVEDEGEVPGTPLV